MNARTLYPPTLSSTQTPILSDNFNLDFNITNLNSINEIGGLEYKISNWTNNKEIQINANDAIINGNGGEYRMTIDLSAETNTEEAILVEGSSNFKVKYDGSMEASAGIIGGWNITSEELHDKERVTILSATNGITTDTLEIVDKTKKDEEEEYVSLGELGKILGSTTNEGEAATTVCMGIDTRPTKENPTRAISIVLESGENIRISVPEGKSLYVNCDAENQHGIYARFA